MSTWRLLNMNRLKELRIAKNLSLEALAEEFSADTEAKINKMQLSRYERGENNPKAETWEYLGVYSKLLWRACSIFNGL